MLALTPHLATLAAFCSLLAVTVLPAPTIAAAVAEPEPFYPFAFSGIDKNIIGGGKRQMFERDGERDEPFGVPGTIEIQVSHRHMFGNFDFRTDWTFQSSGNGPATFLALDDHTLTLGESYTGGTQLIMAQSKVSLPLVSNASPGVAVSLHLAHFPTPDYCVTAYLDTVHSSSPLTVERCSDFKEANAHKTQVFRYNKQTGVIQALRPTTSSNGSTPPTGAYHGRPLRFVPGVAKTTEDKDSSSIAGATTANTATEAEAETEASAQSGSSTSTQ